MRIRRGCRGKSPRLLGRGLRTEREQALGSNPRHVQDGLVFRDVNEERSDGLEFFEVVLFGHFLHALEIFLERQWLIATEVLQVPGELHGQSDALETLCKLLNIQVSRV